MPDHLRKLLPAFVEYSTRPVDESALEYLRMISDRMGVDVRVTGSTYIGQKLPTSDTDCVAYLPPWVTFKQFLLAIPGAEKNRQLGNKINWTWNGEKVDIVVVQVDMEWKTDVNCGFRKWNPEVYLAFCQKFGYPAYGAYVYPSPEIEDGISIDLNPNGTQLMESFYHSGEEFAKTLVYFLRIQCLPKMDHFFLVMMAAVGAKFVVPYPDESLASQMLRCLSHALNFALVVVHQRVSDLEVMFDAFEDFPDLTLLTKYQWQTMMYNFVKYGDNLKNTTLMHFDGLTDYTPSNHKMNAWAVVMCFILYIFGEVKIDLISILLEMFDRSIHDPEARYENLRAQLADWCSYHPLHSTNLKPLAVRFLMCMEMQFAWYSGDLRSYDVTETSKFSKLLMMETIFAFLSAMYDSNHVSEKPNVTYDPGFKKKIVNNTLARYEETFESYPC